MFIGVDVSLNATFLPSIIQRGIESSLSVRSIISNNDKRNILDVAPPNINFKFNIFLSSHDLTDPTSIWNHSLFVLQDIPYTYSVGNQSSGLEAFSNVFMETTFTVSYFSYKAVIDLLTDSD
jgi:hypothetical protein